jgi:hypothetical protein
LRIASVLVAVVFLSLAVSAQADHSGLKGTRALDRERTDVNNDLPENLKDFRMLVSSDQERLMVKAQVVGSVQPRTKEQGNALAGGLSTQGSRTTSTSPNGVMATSGSTASASPLQASYGGTLAIYFTAPEITYDLSGKEVRVEPAPGDRVNGATRIRAKVSKDGKSLELTVIRKMKGSQGEAEITTRERWKLSDDGKTLQFHRTVQTPATRDNIDMTLAKQG